MRMASNRVVRAAGEEKSVAAADGKSVVLPRDAWMHARSQHTPRRKSWVFAGAAEPTTFLSRSPLSDWADPTALVRHLPCANLALSTTPSGEYDWKGGESWVRCMACLSSRERPGQFPFRDRIAQGKWENVGTHGTVRYVCAKSEASLREIGTKRAFLRRGFPSRIPLACSLGREATDRPFEVPASRAWSPQIVHCLPTCGCVERGWLREGKVRSFHAGCGTCQKSRSGGSISFEVGKNGELPRAQQSHESNQLVPQTNKAPPLNYITLHSTHLTPSLLSISS